MSSGIKTVAFLQKFTEIMTLQIEAIQYDLDTSLSSVMQSLQELSASTEQKKQEAERVLENTYLAPDTQTSLMVDSIQKSTDDIFEQAQMAMASGSLESQASTVKHKDFTDDVRRMGGMFSKHMESISTLDDSVRELLITMVGSLSNSDVIKQRLDHIGEILRALNLGLGNVVVDLDSRLNQQVVASFRDNLLLFAYKSYSAEEERVAFKEVFGVPPHILQAYERKSS